MIMKLKIVRRILSCILPSWSGKYKVNSVDESKERVLNVLNFGRKAWRSFKTWLRYNQGVVWIILKTVCYVIFLVVGLLALFGFPFTWILLIPMIFTWICMPEIEIY